MLSWGALRGVMALMMVLLIPRNMDISSWTHYPITIQDLVLTLTIGVVIFSVFVNSLTIPFFIRKLKLNKLSLREKLQYRFQKIILLENSYKKLQNIIKGRFVDQEEGQKLLLEYDIAIQETSESINLLKNDKNFHKALSQVFALHALGQQEKNLKQIFKRHEIDEFTYRVIEKKIQLCVESIESGDLKIKNPQNVPIRRKKSEQL